MPQAIFRLSPVVEVASTRELIRPSFFEFETQTILDLLSEPLFAIIFHAILHPCMLPSSSIPEITLHCHYALADVFSIARFAETNNVRESGVSLLVVVSEAK